MLFYFMQGAREIEKTVLMMLLILRFAYPGFAGDVVEWAGINTIESCWVRGNATTGEFHLNPWRIDFRSTPH
jgi:hypothetical protein